MGGNALASFGARRFGKQEFEQTSFEICSLLAKFNPVVLPYYQDKDSFGDLDLVVDSLRLQDYEDISKILGSETYIRNSTVISILFKELQIDIIPMSEDDKKTSIVYYSFNDLGNLMGKIFHKFGVKYGHRGLTLPIRDGDNKIGEILLSKDPQEIFQFGGFSYARYQQGFKTLPDIFTFVIKSKYFNSEIFEYENLNSINRIRDRKRHTYHSFLEYLKDTVSTNPSLRVSFKEYFSSNNNGFKFEKDKSKYLPMIFEAFPNAKTEYESLMKDLELYKALKAKFNGLIVNEVTGLQGIELGKFMRFIKENWESFGPPLLEKEDVWIKSQIFELYKEWAV